MAVKYSDCEGHMIYTCFPHVVKWFSITAWNWVTGQWSLSNSRAVLDEKNRLPKIAAPLRDPVMLSCYSHFFPPLSPSSGPATFCVGTAGSHFNQMVGGVGLHGRGTSDSIGLCLELLKRTHHESSWLLHTSTFFLLDMVFIQYFVPRSGLSVRKNKKNVAFFLLMPNASVRLLIFVHEVLTIIMA